MKKLTVAVFFGGCSSEYLVSLESACAVLKNLDRGKYEPVMVGISERGSWYYFTGETEKIKENRWLNAEDCLPAALSPEREEAGLLVFEKEAVRKIRLDVALPVMHGRFGEDGTIQGIIEMAGIPLAGCGVLASALCMDKDRAHKLAGLAGVRTARAMVFGRDFGLEELQGFCRGVGYPVFVKPVRAGSSYGITKVQAEEALPDAMALAFSYDSEVIVEEMVKGFEVGCAVLGSGDDLTVGEVDEITLAEGFFDFTEKYTLKNSAIHVPARISTQTAARIKGTAKTLYRALGCSVFARVDMFLTPEGEVVFNEVNTIPGFTEHSRYPGMMRAAGISFAEILDRIIGLAVRA